MSWEQITNSISAFFDKPIVITFAGVLSAALTVFTIFNKTSFGKKAINKLTALYDLGERKANEALEKVKKVEILANEKINALEAYYNEKVDEVEKNCQEKIAVALSFVAFYEQSVLSILDQLPNAKVQAALLEFKKTLDEKKKNITATIGEVYFDFTAAVEHNREEVEQQYREKVEYLENEIKQLALYINEIKGEESNGEQEGTSETDSDTTKEEI